MASLDPYRSVLGLTAAIASGNPEAFSRFYDIWFDRALAEARRSTGRNEDFCLDVVQDMMMRVIRSMKPMPNEAALYRWMRVVVRSCAIDRLRAEQSRRRRERAAHMSETAAAVDDMNDQLNWLNEQIDGLDDRDVHLLIMRHRFGWTLSRIGEALGLKHGVVDRRLRRIVGTLRKRAKEDFDGLSTW